MDIDERPGTVVWPVIRFDDPAVDEGAVVGQRHGAPAESAPIRRWGHFGGGFAVLSTVECDRLGPYDALLSA